MVYSFIHSRHFYSASSGPLLLRGAPDYSTDTVLELTCSSATGNYEWRNFPRCLRGGLIGIRTCDLPDARHRTYDLPDARHRTDHRDTTPHMLELCVVPKTCVFSGCLCALFVSMPDFDREIKRDWHPLRPTGKKSGPSLSSVHVRFVLFPLPLH